jgi:hypothetical protein
MTITFGRLRLMMSFVVEPPDAKPIDLPMAESATDKELAHLNRTLRAAEDRLCWERNAILHGLPWVR